MQSEAPALCHNSGAGELRGLRGRAPALNSIERCSYLAEQASRPGARPVCIGVNIFNFGVQCHFVYATKTLIRQTGSVQSIINGDDFARRPRCTVPSSNNPGTDAPTVAGLPAAEKTNSKETSQLKPSIPPFLTTIIPVEAILPSRLEDGSL